MLVQANEELSDEQASDNVGGSQSPTADDVDDFDAMAQITAVLKFADKGGLRVAEVRMDEGSKLEEEPAKDDSTDSASTHDLYLRMGRVSCAVVSERDTFTVRSPLVEIRGLPGTLFSVQVVLDASTTVSVERGRVEVVQLSASTDGAIVLNAGQRQRFEP